MGIKQQVAANLQRLMKRDGISQKALAAAAGVDPSAVHAWFHGKSWPGDVSIDSIVDKLRWTYGEIYLGRDSSVSELIRVHNASSSPFKIGLK